MSDRKLIPGFKNYEMDPNGKVYKAGTEQVMTATDGKVQLTSDLGKRGKKSVEMLKETTFPAEEQLAPAAKENKSQKILKLYKEGISRKEICEQVHPNRGYIDNVINRANYKENKAAIIEDLKTMSSEDVQAKYDISARFIARALQG